MPGKQLGAGPGVGAGATVLWYRCCQPVSRSGTLSRKSVCTSARSIGLLPKSRSIVDSSCAGRGPSLAAASAASEGEAGVWGSAAAGCSGGMGDSSVVSACSLVVTTLLLPAC